MTLEEGGGSMTDRLRNSAPSSADSALPGRCSAQLPHPSASPCAWKAPARQSWTPPPPTLPDVTRDGGTHNCDGTNLGATRRPCRPHRGSRRWRPAKHQLGRRLVPELRGLHHTRVNDEPATSSQFWDFYVVNGHSRARRLPDATPAGRRCRSATPTRRAQVLRLADRHDGRAAAERRTTQTSACRQCEREWSDHRERRRRDADVQLGGHLPAEGRPLVTRSGRTR